MTPARAAPLAARAFGSELRHHVHVLSNGLRLVVYPDSSAPIAAVYVAYHVGSAREEAGRTGFAHLFEHLLFQGSGHVASDGHFRHVTQAGGTLNGNTSFDRTLYFETVPSNQLELALWLESDRMGFLLDAMTQAKLDNQRDVVRNEKRQNYEQRPYAKANEALAAALFPAGHPYAHLPIGSHEDLIAATLDDVADFFRRWYGPNNATLGLGGDVSLERAIELAQRWFGELPRGPEPTPPRARPVRLERDVALTVEDKVALPQLTLAWPTPPAGSADEAALEMLAMVLSASRASVLDRAFMIDELLAKGVTCGSFCGEVAGRFTITITAAEGVGLERICARTFELLHDVRRQGVDPALLQRMRHRHEADFVRALDSISHRTQALVLSDVLRGDPAAFAAHAQRVVAATAEDVRAVLARHLLDSPCVLLSVVPAGQPQAAVRGRQA
ncbi:MAG: insulinase family protein [Planctomycetes bacterium]|nr:insulinase family protein [Planctomycetota bacterium]